MLQFFDNLFHYKNIVTVQWIKRLKLCMVTMVTLPPAKEVKIQVVSWQNEIRKLDVLKSPTWTAYPGVVSSVTVWPNNFVCFGHEIIYSVRSFFSFG